jgi:hypothetical protein
MERFMRETDNAFGKFRRKIARAVGLNHASTGSLEDVVQKHCTVLAVIF